MDGRSILDDFTNYPLTDIGSSKLYADMFKSELRFVREMGLYFITTVKYGLRMSGAYSPKDSRKSSQLKRWTKQTASRTIKPGIYL